MSDRADIAQAELWTRRALAHAERGEAAAAIESLDKAVAAGPGSARAWRDIGHAYAEHRRHAQAAAALSRASSLDPGDALTETLLAHVNQELGDNATALAALARASQRVPGDLGIALAERLFLPQVYADHDDLACWRGRYGAGLARTLEEIDRFLPAAQRVFELNRHNFLLAYQGEDDTGLQRGYAGLLGRLIAAASPEWREPLPIGFDGSRRLRVGFVGSIFRDCTAGRYFERWVTGLDRARFERFVYQTGPLADGFTRRIAESADRFATLRAGVRDAAARIRADRLDVLVHPEVGMSATSYLLAAMRLAPVQAAGWGHPVTTGSDTIDHYFTCAAMEPDDAERHYVERLVGLPSIGVEYEAPAGAAEGTRADAGLPPDRRVYVCPQSLFKIHPDMDALLARIAAADESAVFVFFQSEARRVTEALAARIQRALSLHGVPPRGQLRFLPRLPADHFRRVLALADVVLDTPRWSGGNTSLDAFAAAAPVVTLPGRFMRGRQTAAMLRLMGIGELVAKDAGDYVDIALRTATRPDFNREMRRRISERREALFGRREATQAFAEALLRIGAGEGS